MDRMNQNWGMGHIWGWIFGLIILVVIIWLLVNAMNKKNNPDLQNKQSTE